MKQTTTKWYHWLFTEDERAPLGFIPTFFMIIVMSTVICLAIVGIQ